MTPDEVRALARLPESALLEFKEEVSEPERIARVLAGFANAHGGTVLVGVRDDTTLVGVRDPARTSEVLHSAASRTSPPLNIEIQIVKVDSKSIVVARIDAGARAHIIGREIPRRVDARTVATPAPPTELGVAIVDQDPRTTAVLKVALEQRQAVQRVESFARAELDGLLAALAAGRVNAVFVDLFTLGVEIGIELIDKVRKDFPIVAFCLHSRSDALRSLPGIEGPWRQRLDHYFRLPKDQVPTAFDVLLDQSLYQLAQEVQAATARTKLSELKAVLKADQTPGLTQETKARIEDATDAVEKALETRKEAAERSAVIPSFESNAFEGLLRSTLEQTSKAFSLSTTVNVAVLIFGAVMILGSTIVAVVTQRWELLLFGGFGMAGMVAALVANPLKSIGATARKLVQVQVAYLAFLKQLHMISQDAEGVSSSERSKQLGDEMIRTLKALEDHLGDK